MSKKVATLAKKFPIVNLRGTSNRFASLWQEDVKSPQSKEQPIKTKKSVKKKITTPIKETDHQTLQEYMNQVAQEREAERDFFRDYSTHFMGQVLSFVIQLIKHILSSMRRIVSGRKRRGDKVHGRSRQFYVNNKILKRRTAEDIMKLRSLLLVKQGKKEKQLLQVFLNTHFIMTAVMLLSLNLLNFVMPLDDKKQDVQAYQVFLCLAFYWGCISHGWLPWIALILAYQVSPVRFVIPDFVSGMCIFMHSIGLALVNKIIFSGLYSMELWSSASSVASEGRFVMDNEFETHAPARLEAQRAVAFSTGQLLSTQKMLLTDVLFFSAVLTLKILSKEEMRSDESSMNKWERLSLESAVPIGCGFFVSIFVLLVQSLSLPTFDIG